MGLGIDGIIWIFFSGYACPLPQNLPIEKKRAGGLRAPTTSVGEGSHACGDPEAAAKMPAAGRRSRKPGRFPSVLETVCPDHAVSIAVCFGTGCFAMGTELISYRVASIISFGTGCFAMGTELSPLSVTTYVSFGTGCFAMGTEPLHQPITTIFYFEPGCFAMGTEAGSDADADQIATRRLPRQAPNHGPSKRHRALVAKFLKNDFGNNQLTRH